MEEKILENFNQINNILKNREEPVTIFLISKKLSITLREAKMLLNEFVSQTDSMNNYIVIFSAEILKSDKISTLLIPSISRNLSELLNDVDGLLDFSVFAIYKKSQEFMLNDYSVFCHDNELIPNISMVKMIKEEVINPNLNNNSKQHHVSVAKNANISINKQMNNKHPNINQKTSDHQLVQTFNKVSLNNINEKQEDTIKVQEIKAEILEIDVKGEFYKNQEIKRNDDEYFYDGPSDFNKNEIKLPNAEKRKRLEENKNDAIDKKKKTGNPEIISSNFIQAQSDASIHHENKNDIISDSIVVPKKIKKTKKVKKTNTYLDEKGYLRTIDEWEDEEYWTDEKPKPIILPSNNNGGDYKTKKNTKKVAPGQSNLFSFFNK